MSFDYVSNMNVSGAAQRASGRKLVMGRGQDVYGGYMIRDVEVINVPDTEAPGGFRTSRLDIRLAWTSDDVLPNLEDIGAAYDVTVTINVTPIEVEEV